MFGYFLAVTNSQKGMSNLKRFCLPQMVKYIVLVGYTAAVFAQGYASSLIVHHSSSYEKALFAHRLNPTNAAFSFYVIRSAFDAGLHKEAEVLALKELQKRPYHFPILFLLGYQYLLQEKKEKGCQYLRRYNKIFSSPHSKEIFIKENCPASVLP